jgi:membrane-bound metal-dependent hydrolase YbcI (DUF457 family)
MGARIDRATHYIFGTAFYTLLVNLLSDKFNMIFSPSLAYKIVKEAYLSKTISGISGLLYISMLLYAFIFWFFSFLFSILSMRIAVIPDWIDKPIGEENHRKFGHSLIFILIISLVSYFAIYFCSYFFFSLFAYTPKEYEGIALFSKILGINVSLMISLSLLSHLILDIITYSGILLFYPISKRYFSLKLVKSGSPIFILILLLSLIYILCYCFLPLFSSALIILSQGEAIKYG